MVICPTDGTYNHIWHILMKKEYEVQAISYGQNFNYVKIHTRKFRASVAFFSRQIVTHYSLSIAPAITLDINTSQISLIFTATAGFIITKGTLKTNCYIIFFILKGHFCPPCPSQHLLPTQFRRPWLWCSHSMF